MLAMAVGLDEVQQRQVVDPNEQRCLLGEGSEEPGRDRVHWLTWPNVNDRRRLPSVEGAQE